MGSSPCGDHVTESCTEIKEEHNYVLIAVFTEPISSEYHKAAVSEFKIN